MPVCIPSPHLLGLCAHLTGDGDYQLVGRASVDVIKASGYKISALEIERLMLEHPDLVECAVVGVSDPTGVHGEEVCMMAVLKEVGPCELLFVPLGTLLYLRSNNSLARC
jgi:acyl-coenzyme A synthetase/AMP-(fatty) acid ligase